MGNPGTGSDVDHYTECYYFLSGGGLEDTYKRVCAGFAAQSRLVSDSVGRKVFEEHHDGLRNDSQVTVFYNEDPSVPSSGYISINFNPLVGDDFLSFEAKALKGLVRKIANEEGFSFRQEAIA